MKTKTECESTEQQYDAICAVCDETHGELDKSGSPYQQVPSAISPQVIILCPNCYKKYHFGLLSRAECEEAGIEYAEHRPSIYALGRIRQRAYDWFQWGPPRHGRRMRIYADSQLQERDRK